MNIDINDFIDFLEVYKNRPIKDNKGGTKSVGMFWLWHVADSINPDLIIESGVWRGASTWLLETTCPGATIHSMDPKLGRRRFVSNKVSYHKDDFSIIGKQLLNNSNASFAFFDDHQNAFDRLKQCYEFGYDYAMFDDNFPPSFRDGHLTLSHVKHDDKESLDTYIDSYKIYPQVFGNKSRIRQKVYDVDEYLWVSPSDIGNKGNRRRMQVFWDDRFTYNWPTLVKIKHSF